MPETATGTDAGTGTEAATQTTAPTERYYLPDKNLWLKTPVLKGIVLLMGVILIIAWILMMLAAKELSAARKAGTWSRELCGYEYMEAETERYKLAEVYERSAKRLVYAALAIFVMLGVLGMLTMSLYGLEVSIAGYKILNSANPTIGWGTFGLIALAFLTLLSQSTTLLTAFGLIANEKSYNEAVTVAGANEEIKKRNPLFIQSVILGTLASAALLFATYNSVAVKDRGGADLPELPSLNYLMLVVLMFIIGITLSLVLTKYYTRLNAWFSDYDTKTAELNTEIEGLIKNEGDTGITRDYISGNIKRLDPTAPMDLKSTLDVSYGDHLYAYVFHADGDEMSYLDKKTVSTDDAKQIFEVLKMDISSLVPNVDIQKVYKDAIDKAYVAVLASVVSFGTTPTITTALLQTALSDEINKISQTNQYTIKLNSALRYYMNNFLKADTPVKVSELRTEIEKIVDTHAQSTGAMSKSAIITAINTNVIGKVFSSVKAADLDNTIIGTYSSDPRRQAISDSFVDGTGNGLDDVVLKTTLIEFLKDRVTTIVAQILATTQSKTNVRTKLDTLRNLQLTAEADTFVRAIFIASVVIAVLLAYGVFHYFYQRNPDLVTLGSAGFILVVVFALSFYGWFMGQTII